MNPAPATKSYSYNLGETDKDLDYTVVWNPVECVTTNAVIVYGTGAVDDPAKLLNTGGYLVQTASSNKFTIKNTTPLSKAGTYTIKVTW